MAFATIVDHEHARRTVSGQAVVLHCHHYNARLQRAIEGSIAVDGAGIWRSSAERAWVGTLESALAGSASPRERWEAALALYAFLGFGKLGVPGGGLPDREVVATSSHFAEGWSARGTERREPVCTFTEGFLRAAAWVALGRDIVVHESACQQAGAAVCHFALTAGAGRPLRGLARPDTHPGDDGRPSPVAVRAGVDERKIIETVSSLPVTGDERGLVPAFNVFLASMPVDFYNLVTADYLRAMRESGVESLGRRLLIQVAEICGLNTFSGIRSSAEWDALIAPMCNDTEDEMVALVAVSNALGWGSWQVTELVPGESMKLRSANGYEAEGTLQLLGPSPEPSCLMLTGVAAGLMALVYGTGSVRERVGQFSAKEHRCRATGFDACEFSAAEAA